MTLDLTADQSCCFRCLREKYAGIGLALAHELPDLFPVNTKIEIARAGTPRKSGYSRAREKHAAL